MRTAIGSVNHVDQLHPVLTELADVGFGAKAVTLLAGDGALQGRPDWRSRFTVELGLTSLAGPVRASPTDFAAYLKRRARSLGAPVAFDGLMRSLLAERHALHLAGHVDAGGFLACVRLRDMIDEKDASNVLLRHSVGSVHVHDFGAKKQSL